MAYNNQTKTNNKNTNEGLAAGFLNVSLPNGRGGKRKLGAIFLFADRVDHKQVIDILEGGGDIEKFKDLLIFDYNPNTPDEDKLFDLSTLLK